MICLHYVRTFFIPDLIAVVGPVLHVFMRTVMVTVSIDETDEYDYIHFLYRYSISFCYVIRLKSLKKTTRDILVVSGMPETVTFTVDHLCTMTLMLHMMTSLAISIPWTIYHIDYPEESWLRQANIHNVTLSGISTVYGHGFLMTCCYFFGLSHGGYHITMPNEEITLFIVSFIGRLYTLYMIADLLRLFGLVNISESRYEHFLVMLKEYIKSKDLPPQMRVKVLNYYKYKLQGNYFSERQIFDTLSVHLRIEMLLYRARNFLAKMPVLQVIPREQLGALIAEMQNKLYSPGDTIVKEGQLMDNVYIIKCGTVAMYRNNTELCHIEDGDTFGESLFTATGNIQYQFTYIAIDYCEIYNIPKDKFIQVLMEYDDVKKFFETRLHGKEKKIDHLKRSLSETNDIVSQLKSGKILEKPKLKPTYLAE
ncbi:unnamed protein product [Acanthoscelides obtectus]|nr:unnamed protein product [Acanthoscelides obtectus]CAK1642213.1 Potassium/sodium hyperpolarization-activated cyclic nucleotide-gated channel 1 [Acanthoscelides obtectus]